MSKLKFRAWDKVNKKMIYNVAVLDGSVVTAEWLENCAFFEIEENLIPQQYTGFTDKNGKEMWGEDLVTIYDSTIEDDFYSSAGPSVESNHFAKIVFDKGCFKFLIIHSMKYEGDLYTLEEIEELADGPIEVIGNIYENPELLGD